MLKKLVALSSVTLFFCSFGAHQLIRTASPLMRKTPSPDIYKEDTPTGRLVVICGAMWSGKTEELMSLINVAKVALLKILVFKHIYDRRSEDMLNSRGRPTEEIKATPINDPADILKAVLLNKPALVAIDEIQFFPKQPMADVVKNLLKQGIQVLVSGLDMDFKGEPFGECMPYLLSIADEVVKRKAVCKVCHEWNATLTQRLVDGKPARKSDPLVLVDDGRVHDVIYEPRCRKCHELPD